jgi:hypothetical protein
MEAAKKDRVNQTLRNWRNRKKMLLLQQQQLPDSK